MGDAQAAIDGLGRTRGYATGVPTSSTLALGPAPGRGGGGTSGAVGGAAGAGASGAAGGHAGVGGSGGGAAAGGGASGSHGGGGAAFGSRGSGAADPAVTARLAGLYDDYRLDDDDDDDDVKGEVLEAVDGAFTLPSPGGGGVKRGGRMAAEDEASSEEEDNPFGPRPPKPSGGGGGGGGMGGGGMAPPPPPKFKTRELHRTREDAVEGDGGKGDGPSLETAFAELKYDLDAALAVSKAVQNHAETGVFCVQLQSFMCLCVCCAVAA